MGAFIFFWGVIVFIAYEVIKYGREKDKKEESYKRYEQEQRKFVQDVDTVLNSNFFLKVKKAIQESDYKIYNRRCSVGAMGVYMEYSDGDGSYMFVKFEDLGYKNLDMREQLLLKDALVGCGFITRQGHRFTVKSKGDNKSSGLKSIYQ